MNDLDSHLDTAVSDLWAAVGDTDLGIPNPRRRQGVATIGAIVIVVLSVAGAGWLVSRRSHDPTAVTPATSVAARDQLAAEVAAAAEDLGWGLSLADDLISFGSDPTSPTIPGRSGRTYAEVHFKNRDGQLLVSMCVCDDASVAAGTNGRTGLLRTEGAASVYQGTDGDHARAVELFDHSRILYVRSESPTAATSLDELTKLALAINSSTAFPSEWDGPTSPTTTLVDPTAVYPTVTAPIAFTPYPLSWTVDPGATLDASSTLIPLVVMDTRCNGGTNPQARLLPPTVTYSDDSIGISIMATPLQGIQACPAAPTASVTVTLDQPLGDRTLVDTGVVGA